MNISMRNHRDLTDLFDNFYIREYCNLYLPKWMNDTIWDSLKNVFDEGFQFDYTGKIEPELRLLRTGKIQMFKTLYLT